MLQSWADVIDAALPVDAAAQQDCRPAPEPISSRAAGLATIRPLPPSEQRRPYWHRQPGGLRRATVRQNMPDERRLVRASRPFAWPPHQVRRAENPSCFYLFFDSSTTSMVRVNMIRWRHTE